MRKLGYLKDIADGGLGAGPPAAGGFVTVGRFFVTFGKKSYFNAIESHFAGVQNHLKALDF